MNANDEKSCSCKMRPSVKGDGSLPLVEEKSTTFFAMYDRQCIYEVRSSRPENIRCGIIVATPACENAAEVSKGCWWWYDTRVHHTTSSEFCRTPYLQRM